MKHGRLGHVEIEWYLRKMGEASHIGICSSASMVGPVPTCVAPCLVPHTAISVPLFKSAHPMGPLEILPSHRADSAWPTPSLLFLAPPLSS